MRRFLILLLALLLCAPVVLAEEVSAIDLDGMSNEELLALHSAVTTRLAVVQSGDVVYEQDGITVVWNKLVDTQWSYFKFGCTIYNRTGQNVCFRITGGGVNGIQMGPTSNTDYMEIQNDLAFFTGGYNYWLADNMLKDLGINQVTEIYLQVSLYEKKYADPFRVINVRFPVDEKIEQR